ncbi:hypothetical protein PHYBOEH_009080 [Phytophthora boehmeriae]|uniref:Uncharacterized protein n=1 Tax=Phytophthora boehmeriae TaxID=109152 RepID=A0A8T1VZQ3_9STRA|nr:hypothetical protein PHYBOEH_009080 [Phytophthora boehmeriae]
MQQQPPQYAFQHDALAPVADPVAQAQLGNVAPAIHAGEAQLGNVAPAIHAGEVIDDARLEEAIVEKRRRKAHERAETGVTRREVTAARKRELAIMLEHCAADNQAPIGGHPAWFAGAMAREVADLQNRVAIQRHNVSNITARATNRGTSERSRKEHILTQTPLRPYIRVHEQLGSALPDAVTEGLEGLDVPIGAEIPSPPFPHTLADVFAMTDEAINQLGMLMHTDFGIVQGDPLVERQNKLRLFFLYGG